VSLVGFGTATEPVILDGQPVSVIYADLTGHATEAGTETDLTQAKWYEKDKTYRQTVLTPSVF
jgi:hypothetical protein